MFMSMAADNPTPHPAAAQASPSARLLNLIRRLVEYGRDLAVRVSQSTVVETAIATRFCSADAGLILARITRALHLAHALEARVDQNAAAIDAGPTPRGSAPPRELHATREKAASAPRPRPGLPTAEQIAAEIRHRPIGAVLADICRDLCIERGHPLWEEVLFAVMLYDGNPLTMVRDDMLLETTEDWIRLTPVLFGAAPASPAHATGPP